MFQSANECEIVSGKTLLKQIVFFGFSSKPSGVVTTTMLIGSNNVKGENNIPECQFSKTITDIDTVNNVWRVNMEGAADLGSYENGKQCYQVMSSSSGLPLTFIMEWPKI